jgi:hypothetical protein
VEEGTGCIDWLFVFVSGKYEVPTKKASEASSYKTCCGGFKMTLVLLKMGLSILMTHI